MNKIFSEGTDVAGTANTRFAITDNRGYLVSLSAHHLSGDFSKSDLSSRLTDPRYKRLSFLSSAQRKKVEESLDGLIDEMPLKNTTQVIV
jgi:hypothetical protein